MMDVHSESTAEKTNTVVRSKKTGLCGQKNKVVRSKKTVLFFVDRSCFFRLAALSHTRISHIGISHIRIFAYRTVAHSHTVYWRIAYSHIAYRMLAYSQIAYSHIEYRNPTTSVKAPCGHIPSRFISRPLILSFLLLLIGHLRWWYYSSPLLRSNAGTMEDIWFGPDARVWQCSF